MKRKQIKNPLEKLSHVIMALLSLAAIIPFVLLFMSSITDEKTIVQYGYNFLPRKFSLDAYKYLYHERELILRAYGITFLMTIVGTLGSLTITSMLAYPLSRKDLPHRNKLSFYVFFTMLFNGGLVPFYIMYTHYLGVKNTLWGLLIPGLLMNGFNVLIMRTFFATNIPDAVIESAIVDGAGQFRTFVSIVLPLSYPILATIGLFAAIAYWNDWYNGLIFLTEPKLFNIQNILNRMMIDIEFLSSTPSVGSNVGEYMSKIPTTAVRMAIAAIGVIPLLSAYPFFQKYFIKGITIGAVKG